MVEKSGARNDDQPERTLDTIAIRIAPAFSRGLAQLEQDLAALEETVDLCADLGQAFQLSYSLS